MNSNKIPFEHRILRCEHCDERYCFHCSTADEREQFCSDVCEKDDADNRPSASEPPDTAPYGERRVEVERG